MNDNMDNTPQENKRISEARLLDGIERIIRMTDKQYGYHYLDHTRLIRTSLGTCTRSNLNLAPTF